MLLRFTSLCALAALAASIPAAPASQFFGVYMKGSKIGYAKYAIGPSRTGAPAERIVSAVRLELTVEGQPTKLVVDDVAVDAPDGRPRSLSHVLRSAGAFTRLEVRYGPRAARLKLTTNGGTSVRTLPIPAGLRLIDDPVTAALCGALKPGRPLNCAWLDPDVLAFVRGTISETSERAALDGGKPERVRLLRIASPQQTESVVLGPDGRILRYRASLGLEMRDEPRARAIAAPGPGARVDLASASKLVPIGALPAPETIRTLVVDLAAAPLPVRIPSDAHQTATRLGGAWRIAIHPARFSGRSGVSPARAAAGRARWTRPDTNMPSTDPGIERLAARLAHGSRDAGTVAERIREWVAEHMTPDASASALRDAREILASRRGVCRDYAVLCATLLRAAKIPARLATGLVSWDGDFYYHAWVSIFDGRRWIDLDPTTPEPQISAAHIELAVGDYAQAFSAPILQRATLTVVVAK